MLKIIYFDELTASDYLDIRKGGKAQTNEDHIKDRAIRTDNKVKAGLKAKFSWLPFVNINGEASTENQLSMLSNKIIKTTISNTILTDYLEQQKNDESITKFENCVTYPYKDSIAFFKMYTPYLIMAKDLVQEIDISKFDAALEKAKGYYELIAKYNENKYIFRFNISAFRNNYGLADITKMDLYFSAIKVGSMFENKLNAKNEFDIEEKEFSVIDEYTQENVNKKLDVFDVILAGVK